MKVFTVICILLFLAMVGTAIKAGTGGAGVVLAGIATFIIWLIVKMVVKVAKKVSGG